MQPVKTEYVLSLSYGKDSLACLGAIEHLGWPLDRIVTADVWATDDIPAEYPPVVAFKKYVDNYIKEHYGITVEHYCATRVDGVKKDKVTYNDGFTMFCSLAITLEQSRDFRCSEARGAKS